MSLRFIIEQNLFQLDDFKNNNFCSVIFILLPKLNHLLTNYFKKYLAC